MSSRFAVLGCAIALLSYTGTPAEAQSFANFETGQVRPLALSPDGTRLFAVNTPDNRLEIFDVGAGGLTPSASVPVGLEPIAIAARSDAEVWVLNHLSDSISIVDVAATPPRVVRTIVTCDEPRDIVFAGTPGSERAFVSTARRGQNCAVNAELTTPGVGRAVVQVYDPTDLGVGLRGNPVTNIVLFGDTPRALARSADGTTVYAAVFQSGNQTTAVNELVVCNGGASAPPCAVPGGTAPGGLPWPNVNIQSIVGPEVGLIVKFNPGLGIWEDPLGRDWSDVVSFDLPDLDVFAIDADAAVPVQTASFAGVGTVLFDLAVNPASGKVYVTNTEARNEVRFEGPGIFAGTAATTVQGHLHESRISVLDGGTVLPRHLNKHIDYDVRPAPPGIKDHSLATPVGMAVSGDGTTLYVAAFGSAKVGVFDTAAVEADSFVPSSADHIALSGGGPTGLVLDEANDRLYVLTRFDNSISVIDLSSRDELAHLPIYNPEPAAIVAGRPFLYDALLTSSNGEASCSSCHVFGDFDSLAWDLGNPDDVVLNNPLDFRIPPLPPLVTDPDFHPLKGPMTTQSLRGMANHGSMHWRGDRTGGNDPGGSAYDEDAAFKKFNVAFEGLIGRDSLLSPAEMQAFTDFILTVTYPPNPVRDLDQTFTNNQQLGHDLYFGRVTDVFFNCNGCHTLDPPAGFFGSDGFGTFEGETQMFKVAHLRNAYQKVGMYGQPGSAPQGDQIRGFGFLHDGSVDRIRNFLGASVFDLSGAEQRQLEQFVLAFDSNFAPVVGQQITLSSTSAASIGDRMTLLLARDDLGECEVVASVTVGGEARGAYRLPGGSFQMDRAGEVSTDAALRALATTPGQELTYTCVPPGSGLRIGVDRDEDGIFNRDELDDGTDPADPLDFRGSGATPIRSTTFKLRDDDRTPIDPDKTKLTFRSAKYQGSPSGVVAPAFNSAGDPTLGGATLMVYQVAGTAAAIIPLPAARWEQTGSAANPGYKYRDPDHLDGPIKSVTLKTGRLSVRGKGAGLYQLDTAPQGALVMRLALGSTDGLCSVAPPRTPETTHDTTAKWNGVRQTPAVELCPPSP